MTLILHFNNNTGQMCDLVQNCKTLANAHTSYAKLVVQSIEINVAAKEVGVNILQFMKYTTNKVW
jgi:hypothetical protein